MNLYYKNETENELNIKDILVNHFDFSTRFIAKLKRDKKLSIDSNPCYIYMPLKPQQELCINIDFIEENDNIVPTKMKLDILYEDDFILIINKPAGIAIHPSILHYDNTISNGVKAYYTKNNYHFAIRPVNRLDKDTSGIVIFAKYAFIQDILSNQMTNHVFIKKYYAIVEGIFEPPTGTIDLPITRKPNSIIERQVDINSSKEKERAITKYKTLKSFKLYNQKYSLVEFELLTGRTHQIRVHSSYLNHPLSGDTLYGNKTKLINRQALHAYYIKFIHPITKKQIEIRTDLPNDIANIIKA